MGRYVYSVQEVGDEFVIPKFRYRELAQKHEDRMVLDDVALFALNNFRQMFAKPVRITSGFRTLKHNAKIGGAKNSLHLLGAAFDMDLGRDASTHKLEWLQYAGFTEVRYYESTGHYHVGVKHG